MKPAGSDKNIGPLRGLRLSDLIVDHCHGIRTLVLVLVVLSALLIPFTRVRYDLTSYLPSDEPSKIAIDKMEEIFGYPGTARLTLHDVSLYEAAAVKEEVEEVVGVDRVVWCDTLTDIYVGSGFIDYDAIYDYYHDGHASMDITFTGGNSSRLTHAAIDEIEEIVGERGALDGMAPTYKFGQENTAREIWLILLVSVIFIGIILFVTTSSYFEPVLFLAVLAAAVIINKGTNVFLGTVSFMTNSVCIILQLATSMDYAIFLLHAYEREKKALTFLSAAPDTRPEVGVSPRQANPPAHHLAEASPTPRAHEVSAGRAAAVSLRRLMLRSSSRGGETCLAAAPDTRPEDNIDRAALKLALERTIVTVVASSLTTFFGFIALIFMRFEIGRDLGIVLAKSVLCSLFAVIFLMPSLILDWGGLIERTRHRSLMPDFTGLSRGIVRFGPALLTASLVLAVPIYVAQGMNHFLYGVDAMCIAPGNTIYEAAAAADEEFGRSNLLIALYPDEGLAGERALAEELEELSSVRSVLCLGSSVPEGVPESILPASTREVFHRDGYARMLIYLATASESETAYAAFHEVEELAGEYFGEDVYITGNTPVTLDMEEVMSLDYTLVNFLAMAAVFLVVALSFRSVVTALAAMVPILLAIYSNMAAQYILGEDMIFIAYLVISCIQLGATIDYAISEISNYRLMRETMPDRRLAAAAGSAISIGPILTSGSILVACGYTIYFFSTMPTVREVGHLVGRGALFSMFFVLVLMPTLAMLIDRNHTKWSKK